MIQILIPYVYGCTDDTFVEYYDFVFSNTLQYEISGPINIPNQDTDPSSCVTPIIEGCTDDLSYNMWIQQMYMMLLRVLIY